MSKDNSEQEFHYGGQAVIEGVMMRGRRYYAVACRRLNNDIDVRVESVDSVMKRFQWLNKPFLRGTLALIDAMALGMKALTYSANVAMEDAEQAADEAKQRKAGEKATASTSSSLQDGGAPGQGGASDE